MKTLGGIGAMILGVVAILVSVGLQTIWAPPAVFEAHTDQTQQAPLTVITDGVDIDPNDPIEYTITGDGEFTLMYGQLRDIEAWVGDAAHNRIEGVETEVPRGEDPTVISNYIEGQTEVPDPADSDLWVATQEVTDEVTQRWTRTDAGEWAILVAAGGVEPAPVDFSVSWVNVEPDSPLIMPLMIAGIALIVIGIALLVWRFVEFRRRAKRAAGRRAAVRGDYTGLTAADVMAGNGPVTQTLNVEQVDAGEPVEEPAEDQATEIVIPQEELSESNDNTDSDEDQDDHDDDPDGPQMAVEHDEPVTDEDKDEKDNGFLRRTVTTLTAIGVAAGLGISPAYGQTATPEEDLSEQVEEEHLEDEVDPETPDSFPVVVEPQLERIIEDIGTTVAEGDEALDPELLTDRVAGHALRVRQDGYRNNTIDEDYPRRKAIPTQQILATWMDRDEAFPRTIFTVTATDDDTELHLMVLRQEDPREQYRLIHNAPFAPGIELPTGALSDAEVENLPPDVSTDLAVSAETAVDALAEYLTDPDSDSADVIAEHQWIEQIHEHQESFVEDHQENDVTAAVSRTVFEDSVVAVRLPNGDALAFGTMNALESLTPEEDGATVDLNPLSQELGDFDEASQQEQVRIRYREQVALLIPQDGKVSLAGYETVQSTVDSPDN